jgi:nucleoporin NUP82
MPKIKSFTPAWLAKPAPGHNLFVPSETTPKSSPFSSPSRAKTHLGPTRTIARSGSQIFVAVGREVRWADLIDLKERWQEKTTRGRSGVRVKREDSEDTKGIDDEVLRAAAEDNYSGFRVRNCSSHTTPRLLLIRFLRRCISL